MTKVSHFATATLDRLGELGEISDDEIHLRLQELPETIGCLKTLSLLNVDKNRICFLTREVS